jgi:hypothetical protein
MVRFSVVEPTHPGLNYRFGMSVAVVDDVSIDSEIILMTDFVNLKLVQYFRGAHRW